ncbi:MAG: 30S ribosomal protein S5 [Candidatus Yanofskybacteria bacterium CG10_big_fil_rev_8_21_14_0_10_46_23]|uniref:Small ribosomal subunit protein uS5 n=1 Tax=Candidatus Yanofskybacteria bacterium CG10_big_fil_rev_8_21_14_0_10_46_23 TaxID=1975098 RepID=A0A2H0R456_9BACT|nr:MAG: 30S ribosomal protein S5 [Candidatus Yanofskybacteria bacterium CG10_big_fil_rev_8_21_14_0_10_46_23]
MLQAPPVSGPQPAPTRPSNNPGANRRGGFGGGRSGGGRGRSGGPRRERPRPDYEHKVLDIARVTRVTKGGKRFSFRATVIVGDEKGQVGLGTAQGTDLAVAVQKATLQGRKNYVRIAMQGDTIPHEIFYKFKSAQVLLKPAEPGHGIKAGGPVRVIAQLSGLRDMTGKLISRTTNKINIAKATIAALSSFRHQPKATVAGKKVELKKEQKSKSEKIN